MPSRTAVTAESNQAAHEHRELFQYQSRNEILGVDGAVNYDAMKFTVQNKH